MPAIIDRLTRLLALYCGGLVLVALMGVIVADVVFRYFLHAPLAGAQDVSIVLLVLVVACSIAYGARTGAHVSVDVFSRVFGRRFDRVVAICIRIFAAGTAVLWSWQLYKSGLLSEQLEEGTLLLAIPFAPFYQALALGIGLFAVVLIADAVVLIVGGVPPEPMAEAGEGG